MEKTVSLYVDMPIWANNLKVDDFVVTVGKTKSNSVYHVAEVRIKASPKTRMKRIYFKSYRSDLLTACKRDKEQSLVVMTWYSRNKKKNHVKNNDRGIKKTIDY